MKISFKTEGGFGYFPGLNKLFEINTESLPEVEAGNLEKLINEITAIRSSTKNKEPANGADFIKYKIVVENSGSHITLNVSDKEDTPKVRDLISYLKKKKNESRSK